MPVANLYDLADRVARDLPRCPRPAILDALRDAWHRFCEEADAWRKALPLTLVDGTPGYRLEPGVSARVKRISDLFWRCDEDVAAGSPGRRLNLKSAELYALDGQPRVELDLPSYLGGTNGKLYVTVVLVPELYASDTAAPEVPEELLMRYGDALAGKAVADLCGRRQTPYYDGNLALSALALYNNGKNQARKQYAPAGGMFR